MIAVIGDLLLDVFLLPDLLEAEQTGGVALRPGGSAANTASWLAHQGLAVTFIGAVGSDAAGAMLERELQGRGVEARLRLVPGMETGAVVIRIRAGGERVMRSARGANSALSCADIAVLGSDRLEMVHLTGYSLLCEAGLDILRASGDLARRAGARLSFDPSSVGVVERFGGVELLELCGALGVDILLPNRLEASALTGERRLASAAARVLDHVPTAVIKDGARGSVYAVSGETKRVPLEPAAPPVDTTGAGDAFDAGFLTGLLTGQDLEAACRTGHQLAQGVIGRLGGRPINVVSDPSAGERGG